MQYLHAFVMPAWLEQANNSQQFFTLSLPILVAVLVVYSARVLWDDDPRERVMAIMLADQRKLGYRRFTPARRWFSAFTLSLAEAQSVLNRSLPGEDTLDLEALDAEAELLAGLGEYAESDEIRSLQGLVSHFRQEVIREAGDEHRPGLSEIWVGYGSQRFVGVGPLAECETHLRIYNAQDLGHQLVARSVRRGIVPGPKKSGADAVGRGFYGRSLLGRTVRPVAFVAFGSDEPSGREVEASLARLENVHHVGRRRNRLVHALLQTGREQSVQDSTSDELVESIQEHSRRIGERGESAAWTSELDQAQWSRSWTSTILISGGVAAELPQEGRASVTV